MKHIGLIVALGVTLVFSMTACGKKEETPTVPPTSEVEVAEPSGFAGGYTICNEFDGSLLTDDEKAVFEKALEGFAGQEFTPICVLGQQVVAGMNYKYLCVGTTVTAEPVTELKVVQVYKNLEGNAEITKVSDFDISNYLEDNEIPSAEILAGGWGINSNLGCILEGDVKADFDKAQEGLLGVNSEPVVALATQVVAGENVAILCKQTTVTAEPVTSLCIKVLYRPVSGEAPSFLSTAFLNVSGL